MVHAGSVAGPGPCEGGWPRRRGADAVPRQAAGRATNGGSGRLRLLPDEALCVVCHGAAGGSMIAAGRIVRDSARESDTRVITAAVTIDPYRHGRPCAGHPRLARVGPEQSW